MLSRQKRQAQSENRAMAPSSPIGDGLGDEVTAKRTMSEGRPRKGMSALEIAKLSEPDEKDIDYPTGIKLALLLMCIFVGMFLVSLDRLIISTAIPKITDEFNSYGDVGWYGTAYLLTSCAFQLLFGKVYTVFDVKITFLATIVVFEVGSALCGAAPNSISFILGRAIAGLGAAGIMAGVMVIVVYAVPMHKRPMYQGFFGAVFGVSSIAGPLIGGAFTSNVTWRWCFYLNLPFGVVVMALVGLLLHVPPRASESIPLREKLRQLNVVGLVALVPGVVLLCVALQWGGITYAWSSARVIALLVVGIVLLLVFVAIQVLLPDQATMPPRIFLQRSITAGFWITACQGGLQNLIIYYLPIWFQAIKGDSAVMSGTHMLPILISMVLASVVTGGLTTKFGYYNPFLYIGIVLTAVGTGLFNTFTLDTTVGQWIGYQILYGWGYGMFGQISIMAAQTVLPRDEVGIGASLMFFSQGLVGSVFTSVGENVLANQLSERLAGIPGVDTSAIASSGITSLIDNVPAEYRHETLVAYNLALRKLFQIALVLVCLTVLGAAAMEWRKVKPKFPKKEQEDPEKIGDSRAEVDDVSTPRSMSTEATRKGSQSNEPFVEVKTEKSAF